MRIPISRDYLDLYVQGQRVVERHQIRTLRAELHGSRLHRFLARYEDKLVVYVCANKFYYDREELDNLLARLNDQNDTMR